MQVWLSLKRVLRKRMKFPRGAPRLVPRNSESQLYLQMCEINVQDPFYLSDLCLETWGLNSTFKCVKATRKTPSTFQTFFTFTLFPGSSSLLQAPECSKSKYHPFARNPVVSALSLTMLQLLRTNFLFLSVLLLLSCF